MTHHESTTAKKDKIVSSLAQNELQNFPPSSVCLCVVAAVVVFVCVCITEGGGVNAQRLL